ncbi:1-deoxy-D-xylulose-5-phosphate reductoisomerase [Fulvimarina endophytica]|uniref:1-deoxy-D-xylulose 5-phosphate reductoisomerase n=1 Tax=Fulvimarina endophytica TaxID=2293836 RepID=A0A371X1P5_9HYPH|nr:1-deoxy-D-xylulose-5-phosphate reductoisomerase [Fulvimarina endophytica]RFC63145.1 1-deoxy-D-xylulose-5-phosphate reductoisomerase [Fulvimarina endophytica]
MKSVSILGATGSIGQNTIDLIARSPDAYRVVALTGGRNVEKLADDARRLKAAIAVTAEPALYAELAERLEGSGVEVAAGPQALVEAASRPADWTMSAIIGSAGLEPGLAAIGNGATLALANKESLVCAGPLLLSEAKQAGARILPVDSEHSAIFQALVGEDMAAVERITITASGGAFRDWPEERLAEATAAEAATHPNWSMGQRITIDSASLFNKAMELIETHEFFGVPSSAIDAVIHPESIVHAMVAFRDGAVLAHLGFPDMRHAIGYALNWPDRLALPVPRLDLVKLASLTFRDADERRHPALRLAREVMDAGGLSGAAFNGAKERALDLFIEGRITFPTMAAIVERVLDRLSASGDLAGAMTIEAVRDIDERSRRLADEAAAER